MPLLTFDLIEGRTEQEVKPCWMPPIAPCCAPSRYQNATVTRLFMKTKPTIW